jgi:glutamate synthase (NADPH/NADH) small chain
MLEFINKEQAYPEKRDQEIRKFDFNEIYNRYQSKDAKEQAARCSQCGVPFCQIHCPLSNNIPDWLMLLAENRLEDAYNISSQTNMMPEICGRICPQDRLCEGNCVIEQAGHGAVTIGSVEKYITEEAWNNGWIKPIIPAYEQNMSVGIIGAGPAGLTVAELLRKKGYEIHIYDRYDKAGGLLTYGIPSFKLEKDVVMRRIHRLEQSNIHFHCNIDIGKEMPFEDLKAKHDAILIATGVYKARQLNAIGAVDDCGRSGIIPALDYLTTSNKIGFGDYVDDFNNGFLNAYNRNVVVIGGGDTAMDCVRTAVRQGAKSVKCLYRRDRDNMPGSKKEVKHAEEEGVVFEWLTMPKAFLRDSFGQLNKVKLSHIQLAEADSSGRRVPIEIEGVDTTLEADMIIAALGFEAENLPQMFQQPDLQVTRWGTLTVNNQYMTSLDGVFAAGDIVRGASLVVWAIKDGRDAADNMHTYLQAKKFNMAA